jgi:hypothetical protein
MSEKPSWSGPFSGEKGMTKVWFLFTKNEHLKMLQFCSLLQQFRKTLAAALLFHISKNARSTYSVFGKPCRKHFILCKIFTAVPVT